MMKTLFIFCLLIVTNLLVSSLSIATVTLTLDQAIAQGKVRATVLPYGDEGSDGLRVDVKNISGSLLRLNMPKGTLFIPDNSGEQTLVTSGDEIFALNNGQVKRIVSPGFCSELRDHGSDDTSTFVLGMSTNPALLNVIGYLDSLHVTDNDFIQYAIWSITDHNPVGYIESDDTTQTRLVRERVCALTAQEMPWYETESKIIESPQHEFVIVPTEVSGEIVINSDVPITLQGMVKDSAGKILYTNPNQSHAPDGETTFDYTLHVEGWAHGTYYVVYTCNGKEVINRPFEI